MEVKNMMSFPKKSVTIDQRIMNLESGVKKYFVEEIDRDMRKYGQMCKI